MKKALISTLLVILLGAVALAHDPRTVAKDFSHSLTVEGAGKLTLSYKSLHYNDTNFNARKTQRALPQFNRLWKAIGKFETDFPVVIAGVEVPKGTYSMGINFDANDNFKLVLGSGGKDIMIPLQFSMDGPSTNYLTFDFRPENDSDTFAIEARYGKARSHGDSKSAFPIASRSPGETG